MSLESLYYLSQIVAVAAILASLIFVGVQVFQAKQHTEQANRLAEAELSVVTWSLIGNLQANWYETEESAEFMTRAMRSDVTMSDSENARMSQRLGGVLSAMELAYVLKKQNLFNDSLYKRSARNLETIFVSVGAQIWWRKVGASYFTGPFGEYVDEIVSRMEASSSFKNDKAVQTDQSFEENSPPSTSN